MKTVVSLFALAGLAAAANAGFTVFGGGIYASAGAIGDAGNYSSAVGPLGGSTQLIGSVRIQGQLTEVLTGTYANEARWNVTQAGGLTASFQGSTTGNYTGSIAVDRTIGVLQWYNPTTVIGFEAYESYNDGAGTDQNWDWVQFDFMDAAVTYIGTYASGTSFTMDTFTSGFDTEIALYDANGLLLADNDDSGGLQSMIAPGVLADGAYYLVVGGYNCGFGNYAATGGTAAGAYNLQVNGATVGSGALASGGMAVYAFRVPTPGTLGLLGLAGLAVARRRR